MRARGPVSVEGVSGPQSWCCQCGAFSGARRCADPRCGGEPTPALPELLGPRSGTAEHQRVRARVSAVLNELDMGSPGLTMEDTFPVAVFLGP